MPPVASHPFAWHALRARLWHPATLVWLCFLGLLVPQLWLYPPVAQDDLLRNVVAYAWHYDYRALYPAAPGLPPFDPYAGFDRVLGVLTRAFGAGVAMHAAQLAGTAALLLALAWPIRRLPDAAFRTALAVLLVAGTLTTSRLVGGRPEVWATVWLLSAASLPARLWLGLGLVLSPTYWLLPLYAGGGCLLRRSWKERVLFTLLGGATTSLFWLVTARGAWFEALRGLPAMAAQRVVPVTEALPLWHLFAHPGTWLLVAAMAVTVLRRRERLTGAGWWAAAALFLGVGATRHILVLAPLAALWVVSQDTRRPGVNAWSALTLLAIVSAVLALQQLPVSRGPRFTLPAGSLVLTSYGPGVFYLPFDNPGRIAVLPSIESAWDDPVAVALAKAAQAGTLTCAALSNTTITHVVTPASAAVPGKCLVQLAHEQGWTLWQVHRAP